MVRVGEETGQLPQMLVWLSTHYDSQFQGDLELLAGLLEPLVMLLMGVVAAGVMLLTLLPMARALQQL
jgi:type IV pilus assembly protein PilC